MVKPTWFDTSNQIREISTPSESAHLNPILSNATNLDHIKSLWLLSFVQDLGKFITNPINIGSQDFEGSVSIPSAISLIQMDVERHVSLQSQHEACENGEYKTLACLLFIFILLKASAKHNIGIEIGQETGEPAATGLHDATSLFKHLDDDLDSWHDSMDGLYSRIFQNLSSASRIAFTANYALDMADILQSMSSEARLGVQRCLLYVLNQLSDDSDNPFENEWTPDALLASIHGM